MDNHDRISGFVDALIDIMEINLLEHDVHDYTTTQFHEVAAALKILNDINPVHSGDYKNHTTTQLSEADDSTSRKLLNAQLKYIASSIGELEALIDVLKRDPAHKHQQFMPRQLEGSIRELRELEETLIDQASSRKQYV